MLTNKFGEQIFSEEELCELYLVNPDRNPKFFLTDDIIDLSSIDINKVPKLIVYSDKDFNSISEYDKFQQSKYYMPVDYKNLDIAEYILGLCTTDEELQRVGQELLLYQKLDLFDLLKFLKYLVDTLRKHNIVWGVGRGSSVSSYVLFLLGVHKINSLYFDLNIEEFLK